MRISRNTLRLVCVGLLLAGLARLAALFWGLATGAYALGTPLSPPQALGLALLTLGALISTFAPSLAEDIVTRGFWLKAAAIRWSGPAFVLSTSVIYVLNHVFRLAEGPVEWARLLCFGLAYACAAWRWRSLWAAVGLHWGWNLSNTLLDGFTSVNVVNVEAGTWLSSGAHLILAAVVLLWPRSPAFATSQA